MADFAPSFSLGLDFDLDSEPQNTDPAPQPPSSSVNILPTINEFDEDDDFDLNPTGPDPEVPNPPRTLKRLRRGPIKEVTPISRKSKPVVSWCDVDDEIEDFDSDDSDELPSTQYQSGCRSSKLSLPKHGVLTSQSSRKRKNDSSSANLHRSSDNLTFPKLTVSPLRKFQLIDSDSDDPAGNTCANLKNRKAGPSVKERQSDPIENVNFREGMSTEAPVSESRPDDLWSSFRTGKSLPIPTPVFDEVCEEYFRSAKDTSNRNMASDMNNQNTANVRRESNKTVKNHVQQVNLGDPLPPAHTYFFHDDMRIQNLVRNRLPNFFPLVADNTRGFNQPDASVIDYMGQFSHGESSKHASAKKNAENKTRSSRKTKKTVAQEVPEGSGSWVNPRNTTSIPKDAGKRRVQADGQSAGHWYTGSNGKRVYVTKTGTELTGQMAYRQYKKESKGGGSTAKKSRKKGATTTKRSGRKKKSEVVAN